MSTTRPLTTSEKQLVENNKKLIYSIANKFTNNHYEDMKLKHITKEDIIQMGFELLCRAVRIYDDSKYKLSSYVYNGIYLSIKNNVDDYNIVKIPRFDRWQDDLHKDNIEQMTSILKTGVSNLSTPVSTPSDNSTNLTILDTLTYNDTNYQAVELVSTVTKCLNEQELFLFKLMIDDYTQKEMSKTFKVSQPTISKQIKKIQNKLQKSLQ